MIVQINMELLGDIGTSTLSQAKRTHVECHRLAVAISTMAAAPKNNAFTRFSDIANKPKEHDGLKHGVVDGDCTDGLDDAGFDAISALRCGSP